MAPDIQHEITGTGRDVDGKAATDGVDTSKAEAALKAKLSRKRTKSGCLTCRKRRIKCGEERPVCKNCIKSKRGCEGYNQRVVFKAPTYVDFRPAPHGGAHITFQAGPVPMPAVQYPQVPAAPYVVDRNGYTELRPRPVEQFVPQMEQPIQHQQPIFMAPHQPQFAGQAMVEPQYVVQMPNQAPSYSIQAVPVDHFAQAQILANNYQADFYGQNHALQVPAVPQVAPTLQYQVPPHIAAAYDRAQQAGAPPPPVPTSDAQVWSTPTPSLTTTISQATPVPITPQRNQTLSQTPVKQETGKSWDAPTYKPRPELSRPIDYQPTIVTNGSHAQQEYNAGVTAHPGFEHATPEYYDHLSQLPANHSTGSMLTEAAVEVVDDDYYDVQSDEEMEDQTSALVASDHKQQQRLHNLLMANHFDEQNMQIRRYDTFLESGMLDHYRVEEVANPLKNPATFRVFAHFISATGPSLSTFERHHINSSVLFTQGNVPFSQQGLWTYTMPLAALRNQGLLHAMLALSSLHIARLQGASTTPSMQHYAWALKRIHKTVGTRSPQARLRVTTIAASMLLGFYEIMTADHMKWNTHLMGAKQLFVETDFAGMTRQFRRMKREKAERDRMYGRRNSISTHLNGHLDPLDQIEDIDENMISHLVGRQVRYDDKGYIEVPMASMPPELDLSKFEILKDLFWWYAKQDAYQSIVSGNNLLMDYSRWADCPPRAPLGRPDAVYGSFDHLVLLLGRIADFSSKDRARKLKQMEANGGQWRPASGMNIPRPPQAPPTPASANAAMPQGPPQGPPPGQAGPMFFGMAPPPRTNVQMPSSYNPAQSIPTPKSAQSTDSIDLQLATQAALEEYGRIRAALREFANALSGEAFQPLGPDMQLPVDTPFGPAKFYRSYDIGCMWAIYNMAIIIAIRSHPHMHPAAHAASAIAAAETAPYANEIGAINAGIVPSPPNRPLNPSLGTALCESCMPSFFAAVQYQRPDQRYETVTRIYSIAQRTGWGSAELIANGCETAWVKAGLAGRGPPYERVINRPSQSDDPRLNGKWEKMDPNTRVEDMDDGDRRLIGVKPTASLNWAVGVMGMEDDVAKA